MPPVGLEPTVSADERPQTYALDLEATGTGLLALTAAKIIEEYFLCFYEHYTCSLICDKRMLMKGTLSDSVLLRTYL